MTFVRCQNCNRVLTEKEREGPSCPVCKQSFPGSYQSLEAEKAEPPRQNQGKSRPGERNVQLLSLFHFVYAGLKSLTLVALGVHLLFMQALFNVPPQLNDARRPNAVVGERSVGFKEPSAGLSPLERELFPQFKGFLLVLAALSGLLVIIGIVLNVVTGCNLRKYRRRTLCLITASINFFSVPLGLVLGIFTFVVLMNEDIRKAFLSSK